MRPYHLAIAVSLLFASAGGLLMAASRRAEPDLPSVPGKLIHPVTPEMWKDARLLTNTPSPSFSLKDSKGETRSLDSLTKDRPLLLYFILNDCPCSIDAEPLFLKLHAQHGERVNFLGVVSGSDEQAATWAKEWASPYPIVAAKDKAIIQAFHAKNSAYSVLIAKGGKIVRMWPGYGADMLGEANELMSEESGVEVKKFDPMYAPKKITSGCEL